LEDRGDGGEEPPVDRLTDREILELDISDVKELETSILAARLEFKYLRVGLAKERGAAGNIDVQLADWLKCFLL
jgi:hypothetical protein